MLTLPIKKKWFDMILSGEKKEEYRTCNDYYRSRFRTYLGKYKVGDDEEWHKPKFEVLFRNGYQADSPAFIAVCTVSGGYGKPEWGADPKEYYFVLQILRIKEVLRS